MSKTARRIGERRLLDFEGVQQIPIDDGEAALRFCRALARQLESGAALEHQGGDSVDSHLAASMQSDTESELSVVIPVYNEEENIPTLYDRLLRALEGANIDFEIVFVDDGSCDQSIAKLNEIAASDKRVTVVELARNFGHQVAITAGLDFARGKAVAVMDADLQDPPEVLPQFVAKWREGHEVVYAIRARRQETWFLRASYAAFYRLLRRVANVEIPLDAGDFCVMDRRVVDLLKSMPERNRFVRGIRSWVGFSQVGLAFERHARHAGASKYTFGRLTLLALDGLFSFSYVPLRVITVLGFSISLLSILAALFYAITRLLTGLGPPGFATLVVAVFFLAGVQLITIGVIGEYVGRIFEEVKRRPLYIMRKVTRG